MKCDILKKVIYIGKAQCILEYVNKFKSVLESKLGDIMRDESNNCAVQCEMNSGVDGVPWLMLSMCCGEQWRVILMKVKVLEEIMTISICCGE